MIDGSLVDRRVFLADLGKGTLAIAVLGITSACATDTQETIATTGPAAATTLPAAAPTTRPPATTTAPAGTAPGLGAVDWTQVNLGFVSAYVLARQGEAAIVDTGVEGSAPAIGQGLQVAGLEWGSVGHVILTHLHPDHIGSVGEVMTNAADAVGYAGEADIPAIASPRPLTPVGDGDVVFGLQIIDTPGHTLGHICVLDPVGGLLVAGDALTGQNGGVAGPPPQFNDDIDLANESIKKLATVAFDTALFGHGDAVLTDASTAVAEFAADL